MATVNEFVNCAISYVGANEDDGSFKAILDLYNSHKPLARGYAIKYSDDWCACFVSAVAIRCNCTNIVPTEVSCQQMLNAFKNLGEWQGKTENPQKGDIIFYDWDGGGWSDHVGIVQYTSGNDVIVIEGNNNEAVRVRSISKHSKYIVGFARPRFSASTENTSLDDVARRVIRGDYGNGAERYARLANDGYNPDAVQRRVNELLSNKQPDLTSIAKAVIRGDYGNGAERIKRLRDAGYDPVAVQTKVNELLS